MSPEKQKKSPAQSIIFDFYVYSVTRECILIKAIAFVFSITNHVIMSLVGTVGSI